MAASERACRNSFGYADGFGPVDAANGTALITCVGTDVAARKDVAFETLRTFIGSCSSHDDSMSIGCNAAIERYCRSENELSGLAINEYSSTNAAFSCVKASGATVFAHVPWSELAVGGCSKSTVAWPGICTTAVHRYCRKEGFVSGFGPQELGAADVRLTCLSN
jgi:hypothetical protein